MASSSTGPQPMQINPSQNAPSVSASSNDSNTTNVGPKSFEDMLNSHVDESALSAIVGSLESSLTNATPASAAVTTTNNKVNGHMNSSANNNNTNGSSNASQTSSNENISTNHTIQQQQSSLQNLEAGKRILLSPVSCLFAMKLSNQIIQANSLSGIPAASFAKCQNVFGRHC